MGTIPLLYGPLEVWLNRTLQLFHLPSIRTLRH